MLKHNFEIFFNSDLIQDIKDVFGDYYGIQIENNHIQEMIEIDPTWALEILKFGAFDTQCRTSAITCFCKHVLKIMPYKWPINKDSKEYQKMFYDALIKGCEKLNITLNITI